MDQGFQRTRTYERSAPRREIEADLVEIGRFNLRLDEQIRRFERGVVWGGLLCLVAFLAIVGGLIVAAVNQQPGQGDFSPLMQSFLSWAAAAVVVGLAGTIISGIWAEVVRGRKIESRRCDAVLQLLRHIGRDIPTAQPLRVFVDFRLPSDARFLTDRVAAGNVARLKYTQHWLSLSGRLVDRTRFRLTIAVRLKRKQVTKRRVRDRDVLCETASLTFQRPGQPRPSMSFAPRLFARWWRGRCRPANVDVRAGRLQATIGSPVDRNDSRAPNPELGKQLVDHHQLLALFLTTARVWRAVRRPLRS